MGIPAPTTAAYFVTGVEVLAGAALVIGLLTPIAAVLNMVNVLGHSRSRTPRTAPREPWWLRAVLALLAGLITVAMLGAGRFGTDSALARSARLAE